MNRFKGSFFMLLAVSMLVLFSGSLIAQEASPQPQNVFGFYSSNHKELSIDWQIYENNDVVTSFDCFLQQIFDDGSFGEKINIHVNLDDANLKKDIYDNQGYYTYFIPNFELEKGIYLLSMTSSSDQGESLPSLDSYLWIDFGYQEFGIYFTVYPDRQASVGKLYTSSVKAESVEGNLEINYMLTDAPEGMTIDKETGYISYTPTIGGYQYFGIRAYNKADENDFTEMYFDLHVITCENPGTLTGKVYYAESLETKSGTIFLIQKDITGVYLQVDGAEVNESGDFSFNLDKGEYYVYFMSNEMYEDEKIFLLGEWYKDAITIEMAEPILIDCGESKNIEMTVGDEITFTRYNVSGSVQMKDGTPIPYSTITFESVYSDKDSNSWGGYYKTVMTDENGNYTAKLPDLFKYQIVCYPGFTDNTNYYRAQYWENTYNPMEATPLELTSDVNNINFVFDPDDFEYPDGSISGKVTNTEDSPLEGAFVIAFMTESLNGDIKNELYEGFAAVTDENGAYKFEYMPYGNYIVFAFPNDMTYAPGFYKENDVAALTWEEGTVLRHDGFTSLKNIDVILPLMQIVQGDGNIGGIVSSTGGGIKNDPAGKSLSGASIFLLNESGTTNKYNKSANNGSFNLTGIAAGKYQLIVDKVGYKSHSEWVEVGENGTISGLAIALTPEGTTSVNDNTSISDLNVFPNPATSNIQVSLLSETGKLTVEVYDALGVKYLTQNIESAQGESTFGLNVTELPAGQYLVKIIDGQKVKVNRFVINR